MNDTKRTVIVSAMQLGACLGISNFAVHQRAAIGQVPPPDARIVNRPGFYWTLAAIQQWKPAIAQEIEQLLEAQTAVI